MRGCNRIFLAVGKTLIFRELGNIGNYPQRSDFPGEALKSIVLGFVFCMTCHAATVSGYVTARESNAISGAKIVVFSELSMVFVRRVVTDRKGQYQINLSAGSIRKAGNHVRSYIERIRIGARIHHHLL